MSNVRRTEDQRTNGEKFSGSVAGPLAWMEQVVKDHPTLQEPGAEPVAEELLRLIGHIRDWAGPRTAQDRSGRVAGDGRLIHRPRDRRRQGAPL